MPAFLPSWACPICDEEETKQVESSRRALKNPVCSHKTQHRAVRGWLVGIYL
jgi:endogenous inhibitor of DNA gyrase (YacG/DUF329 family)